MLTLCDRYDFYCFNLICYAFSKFMVDDFLVLELQAYAFCLIDMFLLSFCNCLVFLSDKFV